MKKIKIRYVRTDRFCRPIFRAIDRQMYFGSTNFLFRDYEDEKKIVEFFKEHIEDLVYFGNHFDCEPLGLHPSEFTEKTKLVIVEGE